MQIIGALILIIALGAGIMIYQGDLKVKLPTSDEVQNAVQKVSSSAGIQNATAVVAEKLDPVTVKAQIKTWILKDGIALPAGWIVKEKVLDDSSIITIFVPPQQKDQDDYIAYKISVSLIRELPATAVCDGDEETVTCVVGTNPETHRVFSILTYIQK